MFDSDGIEADLPVEVTDRDRRDDRLVAIEVGRVDHSLAGGASSVSSASAIEPPGTATNTTFASETVYAHPQVVMP
jgi:hypothetical protein